MMTAAGDLREKVDFLKEERTQDPTGGWVTEYVTQFAARAAVNVLKASETVLAGRLQGTQTLVVTLRYQTALADVDGTWRLRNARTGNDYNIRAVTPDVRKLWCDVLCEADVL